ncbi:MAG: prolyl oligopeptidase family serine peptidase [Acidobacteria bacterium]|nr:prolyl oligopeptidase family serine peptidase [Acidobacteriota bacterium]
MRRFIVVSIAILVLSVLNAFAQQSEAKWNVDDVIADDRAGGLQISPDSRWAVWVKSVVDKEKDARVSNLILTSLTEKKELELTRGTDSTFNPKWSPDGQLIAFVTTRPNPKAKPAAAAPGEAPHPQLWLISPFGGEAWPLTDFARGVTNYDWADNDTIIFAAQEDPALQENLIKEKKDTSMVVEDEKNAPPVRLFRYSIKAKKFTRITDNTDRILSFAVSPDGTKAVTNHDRSLRYVYDQKVKPAVFLYDLTSGEGKAIFTANQFNIGQTIWARDGKGFYSTSQFTNHPVYVNATISELYYFDLASNTPTKVDLQWENGLAGDFAVTNNGFVALLANGARHKIARFTRNGNAWSREWVAGEQAQNIFTFELGKDDKTLAYVYSTASTPSQWYRARLDGAKLDAVNPLTELNPQFNKKPIAKSEVIHWQGALDEAVEGILYYPHNYEAGKKYPLVVMIHGGPAGADHDAWSESWAYGANLMAQRGAFVMKPNYHGSSDYGLKWVESIGGGKYYDLEVPDIEKGVDALIAKGIVDPDKLGVLGWSNGSILTIALTVNSTRYKVASAGAGDVEWISDWGNCLFGASFDNYYFGKSPFEDPQLYVNKSPFYKMDKVRTPTIIFFGTEDKQVPTQQGWMHYRALQQLGNTDVRFILFPGEAHSPQKLVHQRRKLNEELAWFDKYLFKTLTEENEALKPDSPLAVALKMKNAKADGVRYGLMVKNVLVPETVKQGALEIGRFEVTRAQYAQFDKGYAVEADQENYPANNITFEQARSYCEWLTKTTGETYRLANESEAETLYVTTGGAENTLDYWAGYALNPEDARRLKQKVAEVPGRAALLKEVGSFKGAGEAPVFDLGGNVAEWVLAKDGKGIVMGGSADTAADNKQRNRQAAADYTGFRVVKGAATAATK